MRVLIVEDDPLSQHLARRVVEGFGHTVLTADDGIQGLAIAQRERPDVILLDLNLPGIDGWSVARELRRSELGRSLRIVAMSAGSEADEQRALAAGCDVFVTKPFDTGKLRDAVTGPGR